MRQALVVKRWRFALDFVRICLPGRDRSRWELAAQGLSGSASIVGTGTGHNQVYEAQEVVFADWFGKSNLD
jgi:hypothetical protein